MVNRAIKYCTGVCDTRPLFNVVYQLKVLLRDNPKTITERQASGLKALMRGADRVFSEYVRLSRADRHGYVQCYTCDIFHHWKDLDCGHFIKRQFTALRFNEMNCRPQDKNCNNFLQGNDAEFERRLTAEIGADNMLWLKANKKRRKWSKWELKAIIDKYGEMVKEIKMQSGIK